MPTIYPCRYFAVSGGLIDFGDLRPFCRSRSAAGVAYLNMACYRMLVAGGRPPMRRLFGRGNARPLERSAERSRDREDLRFKRRHSLETGSFPPRCPRSNGTPSSIAIALRLLGLLALDRLPFEEAVYRQDATARQPLGTSVRYRSRCAPCQRGPPPLSAFDNPA